MPSACNLFGAALTAYCATKRFPLPVAEFHFHPTRKWAFDFAWPTELVALEIEGGTRIAGGGRHNRAAGYANDCIKYTEAALLHWRVIRVTWEQVNNGTVYDYLDRAFTTPSSSDHATLSGRGA